MQYLTPSEIKKAAPAIVRLTADDENLIDTTVFLRHLENEHHYRPISVVQGKPHSDSQSQNRGRHLVVSAHRNGTVIALLNSHTIWRRAWIGLGHTFGSAEDDSPMFILGAVLPLRRWQGYETTLASLLTYQTSVTEVFDQLGEWRPGPNECRWMAKKLVPMAYLEGHKHPTVRSIVPTVMLAGTGSRTILHAMLKKILAGGLEPDGRPIAGMKPRKLKPVQAPDAVFNAANATFRVGTMALQKYRDINHAFPIFGGTA